MIFPDTKPMVTLWWFWMPEDKVKSTSEDHFRNWVRAKLIKATPGRIVDHSFIIHKVKEIADQYDIG